METHDQYKTIEQPGQESLYKIKGSKFFGYAFPVTTEEEVSQVLEDLKKKHHKARHFCYAWQLGKSYEHYRANDDGEPSNSAGMPIYGQLQAYHLTNIIVVSVRYFGGTKLGVGGLISAYKTSAKLAIEASRVITKTISNSLFLQCDYDMMDIVMRLCKDLKTPIKQQDLAIDCKFEIDVRLDDFKSVFEKFDSTYGIKVQKKPFSH